ncbi:uncharacterized protein ACRADG_004399 [Cochliomyia hominivorax]
MEASEVLSLILILALTQKIVCQSSDYAAQDFKSGIDEMKQNASPYEKLVLLAVENYNHLPKKFAQNIFNITKNLLNEEALINSDKTEILEFKNKLNEFLQKYDTPDESMASKGIDNFTKLVKYYYDLPEDKITMETVIIKDLLDKYECNRLEENMSADMEIFVKKFIKIFEDNKEEFDKIFLEWYDEFLKANNIQRKIGLIVDFMLIPYKKSVN